MLSGAIGLQIIARRLGVELGEQQFSNFNDIDKRELTFKEIKKLSGDHSLVCRALKTNSSGLSAAVKKQPVLAQLKNGRYVIVLKLSEGSDQNKTVTLIDPKASNPKAESIGIAEFNSVWSGTGLIFKKSRQLRQASGEISVGAIFDDILEDKWVCAQLVLIIIFINIFALAPIVFLMIVLDKVVNY